MHLYERHRNIWLWLSDNSATRDIHITQVK